MGPRSTGAALAEIPAGSDPKFVQTLVGGAEIWKSAQDYYLGASAPYNGGLVVIARRLPPDFMQRYYDIESQTATYARQKQNLRAYKREIVLALFLITLLLLFTTTWVALFLSKQVTVPIQALAEATREISHGNFDYRIEVQAQDELGTLVRSFNRMTVQLGEGRRQINEFTQSLEQAIEERERRRKLMEAILENIPTGVVSLNAVGGDRAGELRGGDDPWRVRAGSEEHSGFAWRGRRPRRAASDAAIAAHGRGFPRN